MKIPNSWADISLAQFQEYQNTLEEVPIDAEEEQLLLERRAIALTGWSQDEIDKLTQAQLYHINNITKKDIAGKLRKRIKVNGKRYRVMQYPHKEESMRNKAIMHACKKKEPLYKLLFLICVPIDWLGRDVELKSWEFQERLNDFKNVPITVANPIIVFFWTISNELTNLTLQYSDQTLIQMKKKVETEIDSMKLLAGQS